MTNINLNEKSNKAFQPFIQRDNQGYSSYAQTQNNISTQQKNDSYEASQPVYSRKTDRRFKLFMELGATLGVLGLLAVGLRNSKGISRKFKEWSLAAENKFNSVKKHSLFDRVYLTSASVFKRISDIITNTSPIKDYALHLALGKTKISSKFRDWTVNIFTKQNKNSVEESLHKSISAHFDFMSEVKKSVAHSTEAQKKSDAFRQLEELLANDGQANRLPGFITEYFSGNTAKIMHSDMDYLGQEISMKRLLSKDALHSFVPDDILAHRKYKFRKKLLMDKNELSCDYKDIQNISLRRVGDSKLLVYDIKNLKAQQALKESFVQLEKSIKAYTRDGSFDRDPALLDVQSAIKGIKSKVDLLHESKSKEKLLMHIDEYNYLFMQDRKGFVQKIRVLAGDIWGKSSPMDSAIKKKASIYSQRLNESQDCLNNMFDKQRDITLGSGAGDVANIIVPIALYGWQLSKDDTNDQRIGTSLELGVPIVGGFAFYLHTLKKQYNGFNALAASSGVGVILSVLGTELFKKYKKFREEQNHKTENLNKVQA